MSGFADKNVDNDSSKTDSDYEVDQEAVDLIVKILKKNIIENDYFDKLFESKINDNKVINEMKNDIKELKRNYLAEIGEGVKKKIGDLERDNFMTKEKFDKTYPELKDLNLNDKQIGRITYLGTPVIIDVLKNSVKKGKDILIEGLSPYGKKKSMLLTYDGETIDPDNNKVFFSVKTDKDGKQYYEIEINEVPENAIAAFKKVLPMLDSGMDRGSFDRKYTKLASLELTNEQTKRLTKSGEKVIENVIVDSNSKDGKLQKLINCPDDFIINHKNKNDIVCNGGILIDGYVDDQQKTGRQMILTSDGKSFDTNSGAKVNFFEKGNFYQIDNDWIPGGKKTRRIKKINKKGKTNKRRKTNKK